MEETDRLSLTVQAARPGDAGRGIVRLAETDRARLGVLSGDPVVIRGTGRTVARVWPGDGEVSAGVARLDGETRANAGAAIGDRVTLAAESVTPADRVVVAPTRPLPVDRDRAATAVGRALADRLVGVGDRVRVDVLGEAGEFVVEDTRPAGTVAIGENTTVEVAAEQASDAPERPRLSVTYEDIGGLDDEVAQVRELVELPLSEPGLFDRLGIDPPTGVLLHGPPGTGKTLIARAVAGEADAHFISISGPEIVSKYKGESEERLREVFAEAREESPSIVFFDEVDSVAASREEQEGAGTESRIVAQLLSLMDGLETRGRVVVIGATNRIGAVDPALRRPGRFDREVEIGPPDRDGREEILRVHTRRMPLAPDVDVPSLAGRTHGFVGADLRALATEAGMRALRRAREERIDPETVDVTQADFESALAGVEPSAMREVVVEVPEEGFEAVGGLDAAKQELLEAVAWPVSHPALFSETGTDPPSGVLLHGPPGTGKTLLARAVARESGANYVEVAGPELFDKYVGESEKGVRRVFERARQTAPCVVFFDEVDAVAGRRDDGEAVTERVVSQLLTELDRAADVPGLSVLAATNRPDAVDPALRRPGRFDREIAVPPPDAADRRDILRVHARDRPLAADVDLDALAGELSGYTGADVAALFRDATMRAIREAVRERGLDEATASAADIRVTRAHIDAARDDD